MLVPCLGIKTRTYGHKLSLLALAARPKALVAPRLSLADPAALIWALLDAH
jgi:hypothetical protein